MIKSILVPATGKDSDNQAFSLALAVARPLGAHIDFLHIRLDAASFAAMISPEVSTGRIVTDLISKMEEEADRREDRAKKSFENFCRVEGIAVLEAPPAASTVSATWLRESGSQAYWLVEYACAADLLVMQRPDDGAIPPSDILERVLLDSGRPLLIPPPRAMAALPETIVIAWKPTPEAARAVTAAMPLLSMAKQIVITTVAENEAALDKDGAARLLTSLRWHGFPVSMRRLDPGPGGPAETLVGAARESLLCS